MPRNLSVPKLRRSAAVALEKAMQQAVQQNLPVTVVNAAAALLKIATATERMQQRKVKDRKGTAVPSTSSTVRIID